MGLPKEGTAAPAFSAKDQDGKKVKLADFAGKNVILYFYPKDNTPGCTVQAKDFTKSKRSLSSKAVVIGVSPDDEKSHQKFIQNFGINYTLISDTDKAVAKKYGVWQKKKFMGREYMGVVRSTFLIDAKGKIVQVWTKVKPEGHIDDVKAALKEI